MSRRMRIPIRLKILIVLLVVVTTVVSAITYTMAHLFHLDKTTYINSLVSMNATSIAEECRSVVTSYAERLQAYSKVAVDPELSQPQKRSLLEGLFESFPELVAVFVTEQDEELAAVFNSFELDQLESGDDAKRIMREELQRQDRDSSDEPLLVRNATFDRQMPLMLLSVPLTGPGEGPRRAVSAMIKLEGLQRVTQRENEFGVSLADATGTYLVDTDAMRVYRRDPVQDWIVLDEWADQVRALNRDFVDRRGIDVIAGFARVDHSGITVRVSIPRSTAFLVTRDILWQLVVVALGLLVSATLIAMLWARKITRPVERLSAATHEIGRGDFDIEVEIESTDEIGQLANSFNRMAGELKQRDSALQEAQVQLVQSEKMAAFGQLGAGIAHEVKNPLAGILGCAQLSLRKAEPETMVHENLKLIEKETKRCKTIIENLLRFARQEKTVYEPVPINRVIEDAIAIVNHQLELNKVGLEQELWPDLPEIRGNANQLQQVLMNLFINAQQAMEGKPGSIHVSTRPLEANHIEIRVQDSGPGMSEEVRQKLFEPFFTTKPGGKGTGLGLSVSFGIVRDHQGEIRVESQPGEGACFIIQLPVAAEGSGATVQAGGAAG